MDKRKLYFTCALNGLPREYRERMIALRGTLTDRFEVLEFCDPHEMSQQEIYRHDIHHCVKVADLMLAICDHPATGLGYEMGVMIEKYNKPVIAVAHTDSLVSPLILGNTSPGFVFKRYSEVSEIREILLAFEKETFK